MYFILTVLLSNSVSIDVRNRLVDSLHQLEPTAEIVNYTCTRDRSSPQFISIDTMYMGESELRCETGYMKNHSRVCSLSRRLLESQPEYFDCGELADCRKEHRRSKFYWAAKRGLVYEQLRQCRVALSCICPLFHRYNLKDYIGAFPDVSADTFDWLNDLDCTPLRCPSSNTSILLESLTTEKQEHVSYMFAPLY